jgi:translation initiation factor 4E
MTKRVIHNELNSQFECIGWYTKESHDIVRQNIINELKTLKQRYVDLLNEEESFEEYIDKMSKLDVPGDNITLIAASQYYKLNICVNDEVNILIKEKEEKGWKDYEEEIDLFLKKAGKNYYYIDSPIITVFDDPKHYNVVHPLNTEWSLWISTKIKSHNWLDTIKKIITVGSIEMFMSVFNNIPEASGLNFPFDYYFFRNGILPMWEALENKSGGKMTITFKKTCNLEYLNRVWLHTILGCIGEQFTSNQFDNYICGIILNIRKYQDRVNIWLNTDNEEHIKTIGLRWKKILEIPKISISYIKHDNSDIQYII